MSKYLKYSASIFVLTLIIGALQAVPAKAGTVPYGDPLVCLCFGGPLNGFNATKSPDGINCPRRTTGPFCFVDNEFMPLYWKEQLHRTCNELWIPYEGTTNCNLRCPEGKMVLSCSGTIDSDGVDMGAWYLPKSNVHPHRSGLGCVHEVSYSVYCDGECPEITGASFNVETWAICASSGAPPPG
jgi:hypothetical protein